MPDPDEFETNEDDPFSGDPEAEFEEKSREIEEAQKEIDKINADLAIEAAKTGADISGMFDPTPISDLISGGISLKQGEFAEAGLSLASCIPYIGDLVAKPVKASKIAAKIANLTSRLRKLKDKLNKLKNLLKKLEKRIAKGKGKKIEKPPKAQGGGHIKGKEPKKPKDVSKNGGNYRPNRVLPRDKHGNPIPDVDTPHSQIGTKSGRKGDYTQVREWGYDADGKLVPKRDIDFTDHGRPQQNHPNPHQHDWIPNPTGGTLQHGPAKPLEYP